MMPCCVKLTFEVKIGPAFDIVVSCREVLVLMMKVGVIKYDNNSKSWTVVNRIVSPCVSIK